MKPQARHHPEQAERRVAARRYRVVSASGVTLAGSDDRERAEQTAVAMGNGARVVGGDE